MNTNPAPQKNRTIAYLCLALLVAVIILPLFSPFGENKVEDEFSHTIYLSGEHLSFYQIQSFNSEILHCRRLNEDFMQLEDIMPISSNLGTVTDVQGAVFLNYLTEDKHALIFIPEKLMPEFNDICLKIEAKECSIQELHAFKEKLLRDFVENMKALRENQQQQETPSPPKMTI